MRKLSLGLLFVLMLTVLSGCGSKSGVADEGLVITKDGAITSTLVEPFDEEHYDLLELLDMIQLEIAEHNQNIGKEGIILNSLEMVEGNCVVSMTYQTAEDYALYNETSFFTGTVQEAMQEGLDLNFTFTEAGKGESIGQDEIEDFEAYKIVVWYGDMPVSVPDKIKYYSDGLKILSSKRVVAEPVTTEENEDGTSTENIAEAVDGYAEDVAGPFYLLYK